MEHNKDLPDEENYDRHRNLHAVVKKLAQEGFDPLTIVASKKSTSREGLAAFGARSSKGYPSTISIPMYSPEVKYQTDFCLDAKYTGADGKGKAATGYGSGVFLPHSEDGEVVAPSPGEIWYLCEGVKEAAALYAMEYERTCGLSSNQITARHAKAFAGCDVVLVADHDKPGYAGAEKSAMHLINAGASSVRIVRLLDTEPPEKGGPDVRDVLQMTDGEAIVRDAISNAEMWVPPELPQPSGVATSSRYIFKSIEPDVRVECTDREPTNVGTIVEDCGDSCTVYFLSPDGEEATVSVDKKDIIGPSGRLRISKSVTNHRSVVEMKAAFPNMKPSIIEGLLRNGETATINADTKRGRAGLQSAWGFALPLGGHGLGCLRRNATCSCSTMNSTLSPRRSGCQPSNDNST